MYMQSLNQNDLKSVDCKVLMTSSLRGDACLPSHAGITPP